MKRNSQHKIINKISNNITGWMMLLPAIIIVFLIVLLPQIQSIVWSFFNMNGYKISTFAGLENYRRVMEDTMFIKALVNTIKYVFWSLIIGYPIPIILALLLNEMVHFRSGLRFWVYFPSIMPSVAVMALWSVLYYPDSSGLLNQLLIRIGMEPYVWLEDSNWVIVYIIISMTWNTCGSTALYFFAALQGVNRELYESAMIDGAGFWRRFVVVALPHISGVAVLFLVRQLIGVFSVMQQPLQMTGGGPNGASTTLGLLSYQYGFVSFKPQFAMATSVIMFILLIGISIVYFRLEKKNSENVL